MTDLINLLIKEKENKIKKVMSNKNDLIIEYIPFKEKITELINNYSFYDTNDSYEMLIYYFIRDYNKDNEQLRVIFDCNCEVKII